MKKYLIAIVAVLFVSTAVFAQSAGEVKIRVSGGYALYLSPEVVLTGTGTTITKGGLAYGAAVLYKMGDMSIGIDALNIPLYEMKYTISGVEFKAGVAGMAALAVIQMDMKPAYIEAGIGAGLMNTYAGISILTVGVGSTCLAIGAGGGINLGPIDVGVTAYYFTTGSYITVVPRVNMFF